MAPSPGTPSTISTLWTHPKARFPVLAVIVLLLLLSITYRHDVKTQVHNGSERLTSYFDDEPTRYSKIDTFKEFTTSPQCRVATSDLYKPTQPLCKDKSSLLIAMSGGGRVGFDAPYQTRGCDMRWYDTSEVCDIVSKFDAIYIIGDSMARHLTQTMNVFLRADLVEGARATWEGSGRNGPGGPNGLNCRCREVISDKMCLLTGFAAIGTEEVSRNAPETFKCKGDFAKISYQYAPVDPPSKENLTHIMDKVRDDRASGNTRSVFIIGQGVWNGFDVSKTKHYLRVIEGAIADPEHFPTKPTQDDLPEHQPNFFDNNQHPRLFIPPVAGTVHKPQWKLEKMKHQNIALMKFERKMRPWAEQRGWDQLGMFNTSVQSEGLADGTHANLETNLIKTMMVFNWLAAVAPLKEA